MHDLNTNHVPPSLFFDSDPSFVRRENQRLVLGEQIDHIDGVTGRTTTSPSALRPPNS